MLIFNNLSKSYRTRKIFDNINFTLPDKGMVLIKGENGSGKTTLLNLISLNDKKYEGEILFNGHNVNELSTFKIQKFKRNNICYVAQKNNLLTFLTDEENLNFDDTNCKIKIKSVGKNISCLSEGEQMKCALDRAIRSDKKIYIFDEVFSSLDQKNQEIYFEKIKALKENALVIIVSHFLRRDDEFDIVLKLINGNLEVLKDFKFHKNKEVESAFISKKNNKGFLKLFFKYFKDGLKQKILFFILSFMCLSLLIGGTGMLLMKPSAALIDEMRNLPVIQISIDDSKKDLLVEKYYNDIEYVNINYKLSSYNHLFMEDILIDKDIKDDKLHINEEFSNYLKVKYDISDLNIFYNENNGEKVEFIIDPSIDHNCIYTGKVGPLEPRTYYLWLNEKNKNDIFSIISNQYMKFYFIKNFSLYGFTENSNTTKKILDCEYAMNKIASNKFVFHNKSWLISLSIFMMVFYISITWILIKSIKRNEAKNIKLLKRFGMQRYEIHLVIFGPYLVLYLCALGLGKAISYYTFPTIETFHFIVGFIPENFILYLTVSILIWLLTYINSDWKEKWID